MSLTNKNILMIVTGSIAAQKSPVLARLLTQKGQANVHCVATQSAQKFVSLSALEDASGHAVSYDLWKAGQIGDNAVIEHIELSRANDIILVVAASAHFMARMVHGYGEDLAETTLLANNQKPVFIAPAMNQEMWAHPATQGNVQTLKQRGARFIGPVEGDMACGETGLGRMSEPDEIYDTILTFTKNQNALSGLKALVTSGPTYEPIDPVRFIGNQSSGKQGHAIAQSLSDHGADVTLITGPVAIPEPAGVKTIAVTTANQMLEACLNALPADIAICAAAVSDWAVASPSDQKIKKTGDGAPSLSLIENPDILATLSHHNKRPQCVIGFAAETENLIENATAKLDKKGCDLILANDVSGGKIFADSQTHIHMISPTGNEDWGPLSKSDVAKKLTQRIIKQFNSNE